MTVHTLDQVELRPRWRRSVWLPRVAYGLLALVVVAILGFVLWRPIKVLPRIRLAPGFALTNQAGARRTSEDYRGVVTLYSFATTRCGAPCAESLAQVERLRQSLAATRPDGLNIALVTVSVDPEHDTPPVLAQYTAVRSAPGPVAWEWLSGDAQRTKDVVGGGFGVYYGPNASGQVTVDPRLFLVDGSGVIRSEYRFSAISAERILRDIDYLASEARNAQGAARLAYEAAHVFRCYP